MSTEYCQVYKLVLVLAIAEDGAPRFNIIDTIFKKDVNIFPAINLSKITVVAVNAWPP